MIRRALEVTKLLHKPFSIGLVLIFLQTGYAERKTPQFVPTKLTHRITKCVNFSEPLTLQCPPQHILIVVQANYYRSKLPHQTCRRSLQDNNCKFKSHSMKYFVKCYEKLPCQINHPKLDDDQCRSFEGKYIFEIEYKCEPGFQYRNQTRSVAMDICSNFSYKNISLAYIWNSNFPAWSATTSCSCSLYTPMSKHVEISVPRFESHLHDVSACAPVIAVRNEDGDKLAHLCAQHKDTFHPIDVQTGRRTTIAYENRDKLVSRFWIIIQVMHTESFSIQCNQKKNEHIYRTTAAQLKAQSSTPSHYGLKFSEKPENTQGNIELTSSTITPTIKTLKDVTKALTVINIWQPIFGSMAALILIGIVVIAALCWLKRKRRQSLKQEGRDMLKPYAFENVEYMSASEISTLRQERSQRNSGIHADVVFTNGSVQVEINTVVTTNTGGPSSGV